LSAAHPQLYSRIGFAHHYRPLSTDELHFVLTHHWQKLGLTLSATDFTDVEAVATVARITGGNSGSFTASSLRSDACSRSTSCRPSPAKSSRPARETLVIGA
jgi:hypothetical protein